MNNGTAKILRGRSRKAGQPERAWEREPKPHMGLLAPQPTFRLSPDCDRYRYQRLKREYKRGRVTL